MKTCADTGRANPLFRRRFCNRRSTPRELPFSKEKDVCGSSHILLLCFHSPLNVQSSRANLQRRRRFLFAQGKRRHRVSDPCFEDTLSCTIAASLPKAQRQKPKGEPQKGKNRDSWHSRECPSQHRRRHYSTRQLSTSTGESMSS